MVNSIQILGEKQSPIAAAVEPLADVELLQSSDETLLRSALRHDQVICQLFSYLQVLPLRFGTCFVSQEKLQEHLQVHQHNYHQALQQIRGRAEYLLKATVKTPPDPSVAPVLSTGTAYLLAKKQGYLQQQQRQEILDKELTALQSLWPQEWPRHSVLPQGEERCRLYFLLDVNQYQEAQGHSHSWQAQHPDWTLDWSTALPPYHFVQPTATADDQTD
ncbi:MAG: gas vesicle protein GvpW [Synechococcaceae cyanobacterium SM2_3_1]|nr:gas vesicle protein GvpW [Synechococcaceae cyanobacterium SM2_3_1]